MFERILLCVPPFPGLWSYPSHPHTGIGYLSAMLDKEGIENDVLDMRLGYNLKDLLAKINKFKPDLVGLTIMTYRHGVAYELIEKIQNPNYKIVVGGPHVSTMRSKVLEDCNANFAVKHEGEFTLLELCKGKPVSSIKGLIFRDNNEIIENEDRPFIKNLDSIPFPTYRKFELRKYDRKVIMIVTSRGCPYNCIYCPVKLTMGKAFRARSPENVVEEIKYWYARRYRIFEIADDNFTLYKDRVYEICDLIEKFNLRDLVIKCTNGVRADTVDRDLLKRMKQAGFNHLDFGVEAGNDKILRRIKKGIDIATIEQTIKNACELGYDVGLFFMVGHPSETPSDVRDSIKLALKYPVSYAYFYNIIPFPGTELFDWIKSNNYFIKNPDDYLNSFAHYDNVPLFETPELLSKERREFLIRTKKIQKDIQKEHMKRKLRTYGILSNIVADLIYSDRIHKQVKRNVVFRKALTFIAEKMRLGY